MNARRPITAIGAGITVFLVVAVAVIELLAFEFSALIGLPVGLLAGIAVAVVIFVKYDDVSAVLQWVATALAGFGYGIVAAFGASYVNLVDVQFETTLAIGVVAGGLAVLLAVVRDR
jgi:ABC-type antimicrobial peptide transport system permease subunit